MCVRVYSTRVVLFKLKVAKVGEVLHRYTQETGSISGELCAGEGRTIASLLPLSTPRAHTLPRRGGGRRGGEAGASSGGCGAGLGVDGDVSSVVDGQIWFDLEAA